MKNQTVIKRLGYPGSTWNFINDFSWLVNDKTKLVQSQNQLLKGILYKN